MVWLLVCGFTFLLGFNSALSWEKERKKEIEGERETDRQIHTQRERERERITQLPFTHNGIFLLKNFLKSE